MNFMGTKSSHVARMIVTCLEKHRAGRPVVEPFCGGLGITSRLGGEIRASDASAHLINLYRAMQGGWRPPEVLTRAEYDELRRRDDPSNPMTGFAAFFCSFGGKFWGGYASRNSSHWGVQVLHGETSYKPALNWGDVADWIVSSRAPAGAQRSHLEKDDPRAASLTPPAHVASYYAWAGSRALTKAIARCADVTFALADYRDVPVDGCLVYADPPYQGATDYGRPFDSTAFWSWVRATSRRTTLVVSEQSAPDDFRCIARVTKDGRLRGDGKRTERTECLFMLE